MATNHSSFRQGPAETQQIAVDDEVRIECELAVPSGREPSATAVICHPHPLYGGNMYNNVVGAVFHALPNAGVATLRFNFRGVGGSTGTHGDGVGERDDIEAAVAELSHQYPDLPLLLCGYSFGADVSLTVIDERIGAWFAVAPPLRVRPLEEMTAGPDPRPVHIASGTADDFRPAGELPAATDQWAGVRITPIDGANHFFATGLDQVTAAALVSVAELTE